MRLRSLTVDDVRYNWSVNKSTAGNILVIKVGSSKPRTLLVAEKNVTPKLVAKLIRRCINEKT